MAQAYADSFAPRLREDSAAAAAAAAAKEEVPDFVEGMVYSPSEGVMMTGVYATAAEATKGGGGRINRVGWWFKPWFYQYARTALERGEFVEYIPTREYYHRHTRSLYWEGKMILPFGDQLWFRLLLGWLMPPKVSLLKITQGEAIRNYYHDRHVIQDMLVPLHKVGEAMEFVHREMEVYPMWLCPHRPAVQAAGEGDGVPGGRVRAPPPRAAGRHELRPDVHGHRRVIRPRRGAAGRGVRRRGGRAQAGAVARRQPWLPAAVLGVGAQREGLLEDVRRVALRPLPPQVRRQPWWLISRANRLSAHCIAFDSHDTYTVNWE
jgi:hypothetical protein